MSDHRLEVADAIKARLEELSMNLKRLEAESGLSSGTIRQIINQPLLHRPRPETYESISAALGWPPGYLADVLRGVTPTATDPGTRPVADDVITLSQELRQIRVEITTMRTEVSEIGTSVTEVRTEIAEVRTDVSEIRTRLAEVQTVVDQVQTAIDQRFGDITKPDTRKRLDSRHPKPDGRRH